MRRRRQMFDVDELLAQALSCYHPEWHDRAVALPVDDDGTTLAAVWLSWPGRGPFLDQLSQSARAPSRLR